MLADRREDFGSHPLLELLGLGFAGTEDQGVQAGFVYDGNRTNLIRILYGAGRTLIIIQQFREVAGINSQGVTHILGDEPDFTVVGLENTDGAEEVVGELFPPGIIRGKVEKEGQTMPPLPFTYFNSASILKNCAIS